MCPRYTSNVHADRPERGALREDNVSVLQVGEALASGRLCDRVGARQFADSDLGACGRENREEMNWF